VHGPLTSPHGVVLSDVEAFFRQVLPLCDEAEAALTAEFKCHRARKTYVALCCGTAPEQGRISVRLKTISTVTRHFAAPHPGGKEAVTDFKRLALVQQQLSAQHTNNSSSSNSSGPHSLLLVTPITGRMHQIRAHLNHIGHPLDGDGRCALHLQNAAVFVDGANEQDVCQVRSTGQARRSAVPEQAVLAFGVFVC
jgi:hypothetical protein